MQHTRTQALSSIQHGWLPCGMEIPCRRGQYDDGSFNVPCCFVKGEGEKKYKYINPVPSVFPLLMNVAKQL